MEEDISDFLSAEKSTSNNVIKMYGNSRAALNGLAQFRTDSGLGIISVFMEELESTFWGKNFPYITDIEKYNTEKYIILKKRYL